MKTEKEKEYHRVWQKKQRENKTEYYKRNLEQGRILHIINRLRFKCRVFDHYGGKCSCCDEDYIHFLNIDHINGRDKNRGDYKLAGEHLYRWIIKNNYPSDLQVLCVNCNWAKSIRGQCFHHVLKQQ